MNTAVGWLLILLWFVMGVTVAFIGGEAMWSDLQATYSDKGYGLAGDIFAATGGLTVFLISIVVWVFVALVIMDT